jgi:hypothetical protein
MLDPLQYWSAMVHTYLLELREAERMLARLRAHKSLARVYQVQVVSAGKAELGARVARGIAYLDGMAGAW